MGRRSRDLAATSVQLAALLVLAAAPKRLSAQNGRHVASCRCPPTFRRCADGAPQVPDTEVIGRPTQLLMSAAAPPSRCVSTGSSTASSMLKNSPNRMTSSS